MVGTAPNTTTTASNIKRSGQGCSAGGGHGTALLVLLTLSVTMTWTPVTTLSTMGIWIPAINDNTLAFSSTMALFSIQYTIDPIVFVLALPTLREAVKQCMRRIICR